MRRAALAAIVVLCLAEIGLRVAGFQAPLWYRPDARLGSALRPGVEGWYTREGRGYVKVNRAGWRDREHALDKPEGVYRIAVLGDSYTEAMQVDLERTWWRLLPARLQACGFAGRKEIETLAFAATGWGNGQEAIALESEAMPYQPDLVLLQFSDADDVQNNSARVAEERERPYFRLDAKGALRLDHGFADRPSFERHASFLHELGRKAGDRSRLLQFALEFQAVPFFRYAQAAAQFPGYQGAILAPPPGADWEDAWRITEALLVRMHHFSARNGAKFAVFTAPHPVQLREGRFYPEERIGAFAKRRGITAIDISAGLRTRQEPLYYARHWNPAGHAAVAELLAQQLCSAK